VIKQLQKNLDDDSTTSGAKIRVVSASLTLASSRRVGFFFTTSILSLFLYEQKKRLVSADQLVLLNIVAYVQYPPKYNTKQLQSHFLAQLTTVTLSQLPVATAECTYIF
jgi:hypothetical protein